MSAPTVPPPPKAASCDIWRSDFAIYCQTCNQSWRDGGDVPSCGKAVDPKPLPLWACWLGFTIGFAAFWAFVIVVVLRVYGGFA